MGGVVWTPHSQTGDTRKQPSRLTESTCSNNCAPPREYLSGKTSASQPHLLSPPASSADPLTYCLTALEPTPLQRSTIGVSVSLTQRRRTAISLSARTGSNGARRTLTGMASGAPTMCAGLLLTTHLQRRGEVTRRGTCIVLALRNKERVDDGAQHPWVATQASLCVFWVCSGLLHRE